MFKFKEISNEQMQVIVEEEEHFLAKASQRYEEINIEGYDGAVFDEVGYSCIERPIKIQILNVLKLDNIFAWLNGEGTLEYNGRKTIARFYNEIGAIRTACIKIAEFNFIRDPFWYKIEDNYVIITNEIINEGTVYSKPVIRLEKGTTESIELTVNGIRFKYNFNNESYVEIDCQEMNAFYEGLNRNRQLEIGYKFPCLNIGANLIMIHDGEAIVKVKRKDRWL